MITHLALRNFKSFEQLDIDLAPLTLLAGVNGSGKSSVLQSLAVIRQTADEGWVVGSGGLLLNGELVDLGSGRDVLFENAKAQSLSIAFSCGESKCAWDFTYSEKAEVLAIEGAAPSPEALASIAFLGGGFQYLRADRIAPALVYPSSFANVSLRRFLGVRGEYVVHFLAAFQDEVVSEMRRRPGGIGLLEQVSMWLAEISPGVRVGATELRGTDLAQLLYTFHGRAGLASSNQYRPTNVAFGLTNALPIVTACLSAKSGETLLIENPEAHLHPRGQSFMGLLLALTAAEGVQIIIETHSEHVLNGVRIAVKRGVVPKDNVALHFCKLKEDGRGSEVISPQIDADGRLSEWPADFFDEWEKALIELI